MEKLDLIAKAEHDIQAIDILLEALDAPTDVICFHCQQAVEKYLKAYLADQNIDYPKTHDLKNLLDRCIALDSNFAQILEIVDLTTYAVTTRYEEAVGLTREEAEEMVDLMERSVGFIKAKLSFLAGRSS